MGLETNYTVSQAMILRGGTSRAGLSNGCTVVRSAVQGMRELQWGAQP